MRFRHTAGPLMANILWWRDGGAMDSHDDQNCGEGTMVLLTDDRRRAIEERAGPLQIAVVARRAIIDLDRRGDIARTVRAAGTVPSRLMPVGPLVEGVSRQRSDVGGPIGGRRSAG